MSVICDYPSIREELRILHNYIDQSRFRDANLVTVRIQNLMHDTIQRVPDEIRSQFQTSTRTLNALAIRLVPLLEGREKNGHREPPIDIRAERWTQLYMVQYISDRLPVANIRRAPQGIYLELFNE
jgi:hypothetical protein